MYLRGRAGSDATDTSYLRGEGSGESGGAEGEERDLAGSEDTHGRTPEAGAPARVELGALAVPGQPLQHRLVDADQQVERPDLPAVGVPGQLQVHAVLDGLADLPG